MSRIRNLKPEFFTDSKMAKLRWEEMLLFQALWGIADREGRMVAPDLDDLPMLFPALAQSPSGPMNFPRAWKQLLDLGRVRTYEAIGSEGKPKLYAVVVNLKRNQTFSVKEQPSKHPPPPWVEDVGTPGTNGAGTVQAPGENGVSTPVIGYRSSVVGRRRSDSSNSLMGEAELRRDPKDSNGKEAAQGETKRPRPLSAQERAFAAHCGRHWAREGVGLIPWHLTAREAVLFVERVAEAAELHGQDPFEIFKALVKAILNEEISGGFPQREHKGIGFFVEPANRDTFLQYVGKCFVYAARDANGAPRAGAAAKASDSAGSQPTGVGSPSGRGHVQ